MEMLWMKMIHIGNSPYEVIPQDTIEPFYCKTEGDT